MKRRHFLQFAGSTLAALGINQFDLMRQGDRYGKVLAQDTPRKLALLVGINNYPPGIGWNALNGCITDVQMQQQLLIHGFGFNGNDIKILTDTEATREGILAAFEDHLIKQAQPGDVVVFHYSGHGSKVVDPYGETEDSLNGTLVPYDSAVPIGYPNTEGPVNDIMGHTLYLLMSAVNTENLTVVLDSCHSGGAKRGNLTVRSRDGAGKIRASDNSRVKIFPSEAELNFQERIRSQYTNFSPEEVRKSWDDQVAKGVVIASAKQNEFALDAHFGEFSAGAFTYLMTRYLWQQTQPESVDQVITQLSRSTESFALSYESNIQNPEFEFNPEENRNQPLFFIEPQKIPAEAVISEEVAGDQVTLWLGGVDPQSFESCGEGTLFSVMDSSGNDIGGESPLLIQLESKQGLIGQGKILSHPQQNAVQRGMFLQEQVRSIPQDISLHIGLDDRSLTATEQAEAKQILETLPRIKTHPVGQHEVQYMLGRTIETDLPRLEKSQQPLPPIGSLGLFSPGFDEIVPNSAGSPNESIADAIQRLTAKLTALSVTRVLKLIFNPTSSRMNVEASLQLAQPQPGVSTIQGAAAPVRGGATPGRPTRSAATPARSDLPVGTEVLFEVKNSEADDIYVTILLISAQGELALLFPADWIAPIEASRIPAGESIKIPEATDSFGFRIGSTLGVSEALVLASRQPLREFLKILQDVAAKRGVRGGPIAPETSESQEMLDKLLGDLRGNTRGVIDTYRREGHNTIDATQVAAMSISFNVVSG